MSQTRKNLKSPQTESYTLVRKSMGIVLKHVDPEQEGSKFRSRNDSSSSFDPDPEGPGPPGNCPGPDLFKGLIRVNVDCYWNPTLTQCVRNLQYKGYLSPSTILVSGSEYDLEVVRSAWARRMLRAPDGYDIAMLGDMDPVHMTLVSQTQFAPLPEALCKVVYDLNTEGLIANMTVIGKKLKSAFPEINLPEETVLYKALGTLIRERKLYHTGRGYSVVTPDTFRLLAMSPPLERQMLLTNEEAIVRLHGACSTIGRQACTQTNQRLSSTLPLTAWSSCERILSASNGPTTGQSQLQNQHGKLKRCHSLKLLRGKEKDKLCRSNSFRAATASPVSVRDVKSDVENIDPIKKEKSSSMFSKLFRRGRTEKTKSLPNRASFSSQFPPRDRSDPDFVYYNSRSTQTPDGEGSTPRRIPGRSSSLNRVPSNRDRHSQALYSTPKTGRRNNNSGQSADIYHIRSSSLSRRPSPSPKREASRGIAQSSTSANHRKTSPKPLSRNRQQTTARPTNEKSVKPRPRYESPFYPVRTNNGDWSLRAGEKYGDSRTINSNNKDFNMAAKLPVTTCSSNNVLPKNFITSTPSWRNSTGTSDIVKPSPIIGIPPRTIINREVASVLPSTPSTASDTVTVVSSSVNKPQVIKTKGPETSTSKTVEIGGMVDVEISVGSHKKGLLTTDLDADTRKDLVKIAATWNHSVSKNTSNPKSQDPIKSNPPVITTSTSVTTSLTKGPQDSESNKTKANSNQMSSSDPLKVIKSTTIVDCTGKCTIVSETPIEKSVPSNGAIPRSTISDAKRDFFADSPCSSEAQCLKDDSGFSSSTSTSRPMSVSPC